MGKHIQIRLSIDGTLTADVKGMKGKKCTKYIRFLEELLDAEVIDSEYTREYYEQDNELDQKIEDNEILR